MAFGTWRAPFPRVFGGRSTRRITRIYDSLNANQGDAITTEQGTIAGADNVASARLLSLADRAIDRRRVQGIDPRKLTDPRLARWEAILGITRGVNDTDLARRRRVAARLLANADAGSGEISRVAGEAFAPWTVFTHYNDAATAIAAWPGSGSPDLWFSSVAIICVEYIRPSSATDAECRSRVESCSAVLDEILPAWTSFTCSETPEGGLHGFRVGVSRLGFTALSST